MELTVAGLDESAPAFKHLWGRYILGVKPWTHCLHCLVTKDEKQVRPGMRSDTYQLRDDLDLFYLCGVGKTNPKDPNDPWALRRTNVHMAVMPRKGSVAAIGSVYGATFTIKDAEAIPIQPLPEGFLGLHKDHYRCKNFQFAYQVFDVPDEACWPKAKEEIREIITKRR
jgi:hypothetical protein